MRLGRLNPRQGASYEVAHVGKHYRLRRYEGPGRAEGPPIVLIPPLMMTAEVYDVAPEASAAATLVAAGVDTWVVDFGSPEEEEGGMTRTLDDHIHSVDEAVDRVRSTTGRDVHLGGYSQGGMFAYQVAAYRRSEGIASLITFGSPVDIHRGLPKISTDLTARMIRGMRPFVEPTLKRVEGLPGILTSTGFKVMSFRKELGQIVDFLAKLHDRRALEKRENRRRFLGGEGFVAWPGPALLKFIEEFIVHNRMTSGGFVIDGRAITLADITCPILYFVGSRDDVARPPTVRAIKEAAPRATVYEVMIPAGHFGMVVGSTAMRESWPTVIEWLTWTEQEGGLPKLLAPEEPMVDDDAVIEDLAFGDGLDFELFYDVAIRTAESAWNWVGDTAEDAGDTFDQVRYQVPRLLKLRNIPDDDRISPSLALAKQAKKIPDGTVFIYKGRAITYAQADERVDHVVRGLIHSGVYPGERVGVFMRSRPSYLSTVGALCRLGAVPALMPPDLDTDELRRAVNVGELRFILTDPEHAERARDGFAGKVLVLGGGPDRDVVSGVVDMEQIDPARVKLPSWYRPNPGRAADLAMIFITIGQGRDRAAKITNRRWAFSTFGAAAACTLTPRDTVYCCLPLHHPAGHLVSVGAALVGGARLALATSFEPTVFWDEVRRSGSTVVFYAGEMVRELVDAPSRPGETGNPLRLFAGSGMRADVWRRVQARFDTGVLEFYAATENNAVLANASGKKLGALGRPLPGTAETAVGVWDFEAEDFARDQAGRILRAEVDEVGILLSRMSPTQPKPDEGRVVMDAFEPGDRWYVTRTLMRQDADGDFWFVDQLGNVIRTPDGPAFTRPIEDVLYELPAVQLAVVYGAENGGPAAPEAALLLRAGERFDPAELLDLLRQHGTAILRVVRIVRSIPMTDGYRPLKSELRKGRVDAERIYRYDEAAGAYVEL